MHRMWELGVSDLTAAHANHVERSGVLPLAFTLVHYVRGEDNSCVRLLGYDRLLWDEHVARIGFTGTPPRRGGPMDEAERVRIADLEAWRDYQARVFERTERALATLPASHLDVIHYEAAARPASLRGSFLEQLVPEGPITRRDAAEAFIYQHGIRHLGELEHARALVGLRGLS